MSAIIIVMDNVFAGRQLLAASHPRHTAVRFRAAMKLAGINQAKLIATLGLGSSQVNQWVKARSRPSLDALLLALPTLKVSLQYILVGDDTGMDYATREQLKIFESEARDELAAELAREDAKKA